MTTLAPSVVKKARRDNLALCGLLKVIRDFSRDGRSVYLKGCSPSVKYTPMSEACGGHPLNPMINYFF